MSVVLQRSPFVTVKKRCPTCGRVLRMRVERRKHGWAVAVGIKGALRSHQRGPRCMAGGFRALAAVMEPPRSRPEHPLEVR